MALGFATILAPERISLTIAMDYDKLSAGEENMQSLERVLLQDLSLSLQVPRHRLLVSRIRPAPTPTPRQRALAGDSTCYVVVELCVQAGAFMEPPAQQIAEVCPVYTGCSACTARVGVCVQRVLMCVYSACIARDGVRAGRDALAANKAHEV